MKFAIQPLTNNLENRFYLSLNQPVLTVFYLPPCCLKLLVGLRLGFSHLHERKFRYNFNDTLNPLCYCSLQPETASCYLLCYHNFSSARSALMNDLNLIDPTISQLNETVLPNILLYGDSK